MQVTWMPKLIFNGCSTIHAYLRAPCYLNLALAVAWFCIDVGFNTDSFLEALMLAVLTKLVMVQNGIASSSIAG